jgi:hypothetical protein
MQSHYHKKKTNLTMSKSAVAAEQNSQPHHWFAHDLAGERSAGEVE